MSNREQREWTEAAVMVVFGSIVCVSTFFLILPRADAVHATALLLLGALPFVAAMGFRLLTLKLSKRNRQQ